jgi:hypothetical protein
VFLPTAIEAYFLEMRPTLWHRREVPISEPARSLNGIGELTMGIAVPPRFATDPAGGDGLLQHTADSVPVQNRCHRECLDGGVHAVALDVSPGGESEQNMPHRRCPGTSGVAKRLPPGDEIDFNWHICCPADSH